MAATTLSHQPGHDLHLRAGSASTEQCSLLVTPESAGWAYSGLAVVELEPGGSVTWETGPAETSSCRCPARAR